MTNLGETLATLNQAGIQNPLRLVNLIRDTISFLELDLSGFTILTEAATGPYVVTPVIAALAGAKEIIAITRDSPYGSIDLVKKQTRALEALCNVEGCISIFEHRSLELFAKADIITNLGFVRPINAEIINTMKNNAVIPLMCEAWEFRPGDVDFNACIAKKIPVVGTNEDFPGLNVFAYSGLVCLKLLLDAQIEIHKSKIIVVSSDKFGLVIEKQLTYSGAAQVIRVDTMKSLSPTILTNIDAVIVADYTREDIILGPGGDLTPDQFARLAPNATVIQFAGQIDVSGLIAQGIHVYPGIELSSHRMAQTLATIGPRPVVELHAAGLKVGELYLSNVDFGKFSGLVQPI